ncbi:prepilin peptidase, partial [Clostridium perfringens]
MAVAFGVCAVYLIAAFITDLRSMKIPNVLTVSAMLSGPVYHGVQD